MNYTKIDTLDLGTIKNHLNVEHDLDDTLIELYRDVSLEYSNEYTFKCFTYAEEIMDYTDIVDCTKKQLPDTVEILDKTLLTTVITEDYTWDKNTEELIFPEIENQDNFKLIFKKNIVDNKIVQSARLLHIGTMYLNRENEAYNIKSLPLGVKTLLDLVQGSNI